MSHTIVAREKNAVLAELHFTASNRNMAAMVYTVLDAIDFDSGVCGNGLDKIYSKEHLQIALKGVEYFKEEDFDSFRLSDGDEKTDNILNYVSRLLFGNEKALVKEDEVDNQESCAKKCRNFIESIQKKMTGDYVRLQFR